MKILCVFVFVFTFDGSPGRRRSIAWLRRSTPGCVFPSLLFLHVVPSGAEPKGPKRTTLQAHHPPLCARITSTVITEPLTRHSSALTSYSRDYILLQMLQKKTCDAKISFFLKLNFPILLREGKL